jgi:hypothetical protein
MMHQAATNLETLIPARLLVDPGLRGPAVKSKAAFRVDLGANPDKMRSLFRIAY